MSFISPIFLFGLFSVPIPFIIHLWYRHRLKRIWFPSISLIKSAERGAVSFRRLKDIILLVLRTLALLFLVLGFANPSLMRRQKIAILDDSWDMQTRTGSHTLFEIGEQKAKALTGAKILLASGAPYPSSCKYQKFALPTNHVDYIITKEGKLSANIPAKLIELKAEENNFSIDSVVWAKNTASLLVFVTNHTSQERKKLITLTTELSTLSSQLSVPPYSTVPLLFPIVAKGGATSECAGTVKIDEEDALTLDNTRYFVYIPLPELKVLLVGDTANAFFLKNALSPTGKDSRIQVKISPTIISPSDYDMIAFLSSHHTIRASDHQTSRPAELFIPIDAPEVDGFLTLDRIMDSHPVFRDFQFISELKQIKFIRRIRWTRQSLINQTPTAEEGKVLASFSDGSPAIIEHSPRSMSLAFPLNPSAGDLVISPLFVPLMHRIAYYLAAKPIEEHNFVVGEQVKFKVPEFKSYKCVGPSVGGQNFEPLLTPQIEKEGLYIYFTPTVPGVYEIPGVTKFAVNLSNELVYPDLDVERLQERVNIKKWFFLFALLLLVAELIIRRI